jgi:hypothetical protein
VIHRAPGGARPADHRRVKRREPANDGGTLADEWVGDYDDARRVEQAQRLSQRVRGRAMTATRVTEQNEDTR